MDVDLVDDRVVVAALNAVVDAQCHVVAQVVEAELVVGAVGDVAGVGLAPFGRGHLGEDRAHLQAQEVVDATHLLGLELSQIVVHGDHVDALAGQRVQVGREHGDQGLAFTGLHLSDVAPVQRGRALDLDVEMALAENPLAGLSDGGERLGHQRVEGLPCFIALLEFLGLPPQLVIRHRLEVGLDRVHLVRDDPQLLQLAALAHVQHLVQ